MASVACLAMVAVIVTASALGNAQPGRGSHQGVDVAAPRQLTSTEPFASDVPISVVKQSLASILELGASGVAPTDLGLVAQGGFKPLRSVVAGGPATLDFTAAGAPHELYRLWASNESASRPDEIDPCAEKLSTDVFLSCTTVAAGDLEFTITTASTTSEQLPTAAGGPPDGLVRYVRSVTLLDSDSGAVAFHDNVDVDSGTPLSESLFSISDNDAMAIVAETDRLYGQLLGR